MTTTTNSLQLFLLLNPDWPWEVLWPKKCYGNGFEYWPRETLFHACALGVLPPYVKTPKMKNRVVHPSHFSHTSWGPGEMSPCSYSTPPHLTVATWVSPVILTEEPHRKPHSIVRNNSHCFEPLSFGAVVMSINNVMVYTLKTFKLNILPQMGLRHSYCLDLFLFRGCFSPFRLNLIMLHWLDYYSYLIYSSIDRQLCWVLFS